MPTEVINTTVGVALPVIKSDAPKLGGKKSDHKNPFYGHYIQPRRIKFQDLNWWLLGTIYLFQHRKHFTDLKHIKN